MFEQLEFIIPCGGKSTRNYPHAKGLAHKSLMPFGNVRLIDAVLKDIVQMGARHVTFVCPNEAAIAGFREALRNDSETERKLRAAGRIEIADALAETFLPEDMDIKFVPQHTPLGTAHLLGLVHRISPERHGVMVFPDDIVLSPPGKTSHLQRMAEAFLKDETQILLTGIQKDDVSNNAILHQGRLIEKPKAPPNNIAGVSPIILPAAVLDSIEKQLREIEKTGRLPEGLAHAEWIYVDGINSFLDAQGPQTPHRIAFFMKDAADILLDTGTLPLYEEAQVRALLTLSRFREANRKLARELLEG